MFKNFNLTQRNKLVLVGLLASILLIATCAGYAVNKIQEKMYASYSDFGQLLVKTFAIQSYDIVKNSDKSAIKHYADLILKNNKDISHLTFKNSRGETLYTINKDQNEEISQINISSPIVSQKGSIIGSVEIGLNADMAKSVTNATKNSMVMVFLIAWAVFSFILVVNTIWATRELSLLQEGVKEIENGKFGTTLMYGKTSKELAELFNSFNNMSKKLHSYEEQNIDTLTVEKNKLEAVLMGIVNGVVVCDNYDKISLLNDSARQILTSEGREILGTQIQNYCDTNGVICFRDKIEIFKSTPLEVMEKQPLEFNVNIDERVVKTIISPLYSKVHDYLGYIIILIDITREAEVDKLKSDFISNVSHELRTPVTILRSYADTLYNYGDDFSHDEQREFIGTINQEVIRLNGMVNDILDFSKIQQNSKMEKTVQDLSLIVEKNAESLKILANEKNVKIKLSKEEELPEIPFNVHSIERVLNNLISNAIKYSPENSEILVNTRFSDNKNFIEVTVRDFGCGIAPQHIEKIFDRFYRVENDTHTIKGTGLGLHLVKIAIEKHHKGEVFVNSTVGEGSTFGFLLPVAIIEEEDVELSKRANQENVEV